METMKKSTLTIFCILAGCIFVLSGIWIYFQKNLDRVELGEGERATAYQRHYLMIANDHRGIEGWNPGCYSYDR